MKKRHTVLIRDYMTTKYIERKKRRKIKQGNEENVWMLMLWCCLIVLGFASYTHTIELLRFHHMLSNCYFADIQQLCKCVAKDSSNSMSIEPNLKWSKISKIRVNPSCISRRCDSQASWCAYVHSVRKRDCQWRSRSCGFRMVVCLFAMSKLSVICYSIMFVKLIKVRCTNAFFSC
jgi:hypothetical protein